MYNVAIPKKDIKDKKKKLFMISLLDNSSIICRSCKSFSSLNIPLNSTLFNELKYINKYNTINFFKFYLYLNLDYMFFK